MRDKLKLLLACLIFVAGAAVGAEEAGESVAEAEALAEIPEAERTIPLNPDDPSFYAWREMRDFADRRRLPRVGRTDMPAELDEIQMGLAELAERIL